MRTPRALVSKTKPPPQDSRVTSLLLTSERHISRDTPMWEPSLLQRRSCPYWHLSTPEAREETLQGSELWDSEK